MSVGLYSSIRFRAVRHEWEPGIEIRAIRFDDETLKGYVMLPPALASDPITPGAVIRPSEPMLRLNPDEAQALADELWACGIRPRAGHGSEGQLGATERHLDDMRALLARFTGADL